MFDLIIACSSTDLLQQLHTIDISVPPRTEGRTTKQCEQWSICRLLATYAETDLLGYPLRVEHKDRPDIILSMSSVCVGIEITEAVPKNWAWATAMALKNNYDNPRLIPRFQPRETKLPSDEVERIARGDSRGSIWSGDSVEREWAKIMVYFSQEKAKKYANLDFEKFQKNWLVIYDNWPLPAVEEDKAAILFHQLLANLKEPLPFDRVFVECSKTFWEFTLASYACHAINDLWTES
ncbi:MAG: hypothetical protein IPL99_18280 [Candidatus Competibacteraceae bacterium]|nr:hypothetical protein [Candidatus Competibacteraceae bacterium]